MLNDRRVHHAQFIWLELSRLPALQGSLVSQTLGVINLRQIIILHRSHHPERWPLTSGTVAEGGRLHPTQLASYGVSSDAKMSLFILSGNLHARKLPALGLTQGVLHFILSIMLILSS